MLLRRLLAPLALLTALLSSPALASNCPAFSYTLTNGQTADATQVMANFNTLLTCANGSLAHSGANTDITSLGGLTTPISVAQGGTGGTSAATARTALGLGTAATQNTGSSGANVPLMNGGNTWSATQTFSVAPVFTDGSGTRTALSLGNSATRTVGTTAGTVAAGDDSRFVALTQNSKSAGYTFVIGDAGGQIYHPSADTTARAWVIPANASVAYLTGTKIEIINDCSAGVITLSITSDTLVWFPAGTTGTRSIAACGAATLTKVTSTRWVLTGVGVS